MRLIRACLVASLVASLAPMTACGGDDTGGKATGDTIADGNLAPVVTIKAPLEGAVLAAGEAVTFSGVVSDDRDAPDALKLLWASDRAAAPLSQAPPNSFGGTTIEVSTLAPGLHVITLAATDSAGKVGTASITVTVNEAPGAPEVAISPIDPKTGDALTATVTRDAEDPNRASSALTYSYRWFKDGVFANLTGPTVAAALTTKGEVWEVRVLARDGLADGAEAKSSVTIGNTPPSCATVALTPSAANTTKDLSCTCAGFDDADGDTAEHRCAFMDGATALPGDGACTLPASATDKGMEIQCVLTPSDGEDDGPALTSTAVPILNAPPTAPTVTLGPATADARTTVSCALAAPGTDPDGDSLTYAVTWRVDGFENAGVTQSSVTAGTLVDSAGQKAKRGSRLSCQLRASDGAAQSAPATSEELVLGNAPPTVDNVLVTSTGGAPINENAVLRCQPADVADADGDPVTLSYVWVVAGAEVAGVTGPNLTGEHFAKGQTVSCSAQGDDGQGGLSAASAAKNTVTIGNAPPSLLGATLVPAALSIYDQVTCVPDGWTDPDGDPLEVTYAWFESAGGALTAIPGQNGPKLTPDMLSVGDLLVCQVTPKNGTDLGPMVESPPATIVPPAPTAPVVTVSAPEGAAGAVRCDFVQPAKHFAGSITYAFYWRVNGGAENLGNATISGLSDCDLAACRAVATDGTTTLSSAPASALLPVGEDCDTGDACKTATCKPAGGCNFVLASDIACDDGNACTTGDHCELGFCLAGGFAADGASCEDGTFCTGSDTCDGAGSCQGGASPCQTAAQGCLVGSCDELEDKCLVAPKPASTSCSDGSGCTTGDACNATGVCLPGTPVTCSQPGDACNERKCKSLSATDHACELTPKPAGVACSTGDFCTVNESCDGAGACAGGEERDCVAEVGDDCNGAYCEPTLARCLKVPAPAGTLCDDDNVCTVTDACVNGTCQGSGDVCLEEVVSIGAADSRPSVASLGFGRYAVNWWDSSQSPVRVRYADGLGSRENEEVASNTTARVANWTAEISARPDGTVAVPYYQGATYQGAGGAPCPSSGGCAGYFTVSHHIRGLALDVAGATQADNASLTTTFYLNACYQGWASVDSSKAQTLAMPNGEFGFVVSESGSSGSTAVCSLSWTQPPGSVKLYPPTGLMTVGSAIELATGATTWDAQMSKDGSGTFLLVWSGADRLTLYGRRFDSGGQAAAGSATPWTLRTEAAGNLIYAARVVPLSDSKFAAFWEAAVADGSGRGVFGAIYDEAGTVLVAPFRVNVGTAGDQRLGAAARFSNDDFVVVYDDQNGDASGWGVKARLYTATGSPKGAPMDINRFTAGTQHLPTVQVLDTDEWVVAFVDGNKKVWTRRYMADGKPSMGRIERKLNATTAGAQKNPSAARIGGKVLAAWESPVSGLDQTEILARVITTSGPTLSPEFRVNTTELGAQLKPVVASGSSHYAVAWESTGQDGSAEGIYARVFDTDGQALTGELAVPQTTVGFQRNPAVALGASDKVYVAWGTATSVSGSIADVYLRVFDAAGAPLTNELVVNTTLAALQDKPAIVVGPDANAVVAWHSNGQDGSGYGVFVRKLDGAGNGLSAETQVNTSIDLDQRAPTIAVNAAGTRLAVCWESLGQDAADSLGVFCQVLDYATLAKVGAEVRVHALSAGEQRAPRVSWLGTGEIVVAWESEGVDGSSFAAQYRRLTATGSLTGPRTVMNRTWAGAQEHPAIVPLTGAGLLVLWDSADQDGSDKGVYYRMMSAF